MHVLYYQIVIVYYSVDIQSCHLSFQGGEPTGGRRRCRFPDCSDAENATLKTCYYKKDYGSREGFHVGKGSHHLPGCGDSLREEELRVKKVEFEVTVYTFQIDFAGHVNNSVYLQWMEIGRTKLLEAAGMKIPSMMEEGVVPVLASTEIAYKRPLSLGDRVRVQVWLSAISGASARIEARFLDAEGVLVASGSQRGVFADTRSGCPLRITAGQREAHRPFLQETREGPEGGDSKRR